MDPAAVPQFPTGETAALACAACWSVSAVAFTAASRRVGGIGVNQFRLLLACVLLAITWAVSGAVTGFEPAPPSRQTMLLGASAIVGVTLGDLALFRALVLLGARRVMLLAALAPVFVAVLAALLLDERIGAVGVAGMGIALAGIAWVVLDRAPAADPSEPHVGAGVLFGVLAALGQAVGAILTRAGLGAAPEGSFLAGLATGDAARPVPVTPLLGALIRLVVGCGALLLFTVPTGRAARVRDVASDRTALRWTVGGTVFGPFVGIWLSLVALAHTDAAVAQTLLSLTPVLVLPVNRLLTGERATARAYVGAVLAVSGVTLLIFRHRLGG